MLTMETEVEELLTLVINCGKDIDDAVNQLQNMSEVVKNGVKQAQDELRKEADNQIWQEGILRHVPIVGSFYNWLSPVPEEVKAKGRYLNLQEGKLESTDKMYKHHMQVSLWDSMGKVDQVSRQKVCSNKKLMDKHQSIESFDDLMVLSQAISKGKWDP